MGIVVKIFVRAHAGLMAFLFVVMAALLPISAAHAQSAPTITSVSPFAGVYSGGGKSITIEGTNFDSSVQVFVGGNPATLVSWTSTQVVATPPTGFGGGPGFLEVRTADGSAFSSWGYSPTPVVTYMPTSAGSPDGGTVVTFEGSNLFEVDSVTFNGVAGTSFSRIANSITVTTPPGSGTAQIDLVSTNAGTIALTNTFTYFGPAPTITSVSPSSGYPGTVVTATGSGFSALSNLRVDIENGPEGAQTLNPTVVDDTTITFIIPSTRILPAGPYNIYFYFSPNRVAGGGMGDPQFTILPPPAITDVSPNAGSVGGGTTVTITGTDFQDATSVRFNGIDAASFAIDSATQITAVTPAAESASVVDVEVTNASGTGKSVGGFSYLSAPSLAGVGTLAGPTTGGTSVAIFGVNLDNATVTFGGVPATITSNSSTMIEVTSPPNSEGLQAIEVTTVGGTAKNPNDFQYFMEPVVTSITPAGGPRTGGTIVTITGTNFDDVTSVRFGDNNGTNFVRSGSTQITVQAPSGSGPTSVDLNTPFSSTSVNNGYTYGDPPTISSISPSFGLPAGGTSVIIRGNFFGVTAVRFGDTPASTFNVDSFSQITAVAPAGAEGSVDIVVTSPVGSATSVNGFTYAGAPTISQVSPNAGPSDTETSVVITGTNFTGRPTVRFGTTNATSVTVNSTTQITAIAPANMQSVVNVSVTTDAGTATLANGFTYAKPPTILSVSPNSGAPAGGTSVTISGSNLTGATAVKFGTVPATSFTVTSSTSITAITPPGAAGFVSVSVTGPAGTATQPSGFNYASTEPKITGVFPSSGSAAGGNSVSISGQNLLNTTSVTFGGVPALSLTLTKSPLIRQPDH